VAIGITVFTLAMKYLPIFHEAPVPKLEPKRTAPAALPIPAR
jgi:hypothetical protein